MKWRGTYLELKWQIRDSWAALRAHMRPHITRRQLLCAPGKPWSEKRIYDSIYLVPSGRLHDSGYMCIAIVGTTWSEPSESGKRKAQYEVAAWPDDIEWRIPEGRRLKVAGYSDLVLAQVRTDCEYPSGVMRMWGRGKFEVGTSLSTTRVRFIPTEDKNITNKGGPRC